MFEPRYVHLYVRFENMVSNIILAVVDTKIRKDRYINATVQFEFFTSGHRNQDLTISTSH